MSRIISFCIIIFHCSYLFAQTDAGALAFNGTTSYIHAPHHNGLNFSSNFTVEAWIKPLSGGAIVQTALSKANASTSSGFSFPATSNRWSNIGIQVYIDGVLRSLYVPLSNSTSWTHCAASYDGNSLKLYLNGILMNSVNYVGTVNNNSDSLFVGIKGDKTGIFKGQMDEVRIWNRTLSDCEILHNKDCQLSLPQTGLQAYYRFNQGVVNADNTAINSLDDLSPNALTGNLVGFSLTGSASNWVDGNIQGTCSPFASPTLNATAEVTILAVGSTIRLYASGMDSYSWTGPNGFASTLPNPEISAANIINTGMYQVIGSRNGCTLTAAVNITVAVAASGLHSSGSNEKISIPHNAVLNFTQGFTVEAWLNPKATNISQSVVSKGFSGNANGIEFIGTDDGWLQVSMKIKVNNTSYALSAPFPGTNQWHHVAGVYDGSKMFLYVNGTLLALRSLPDALPQNTNPLIIGNSEAGGDTYVGILDEIRIWNRPLNACEINARKTSEINATFDNLVAYYRFNQGLINVPNTDQTVLYDTSANQLDGMLTGYGLSGLSSTWNTGKYIDQVSGANSFTLPTTHAIVTQAVNYIGHETDNCTVLTKVMASGSNPVAGDCTSEVWIESAVVNYADNMFVKRHYQITPVSNPTTSTATVTLYFTQEDFDHYNSNVYNNVFLPTGPTDNVRKSLIRIAKFSGSSANGTGLPASYTGAVEYLNPDDNQVVWNTSAGVWEISFTVQGFSGFFVQASMLALPLTWKDFQATKQHSGTLLTWQTADEVNASHFVIEHQSGNASWKAVGKLNALGKGNQKNFYSYFHPYPVAGMNHYRIQQIDQDRSFSYSSTKSIQFGLDHAVLKIISNPITNGILKVYLPQNETLAMYSIDGRLLKKLDLQSGFHEIKLDFFVNGIILLRVKDLVQRIVVF